MVAKLVQVVVGFLAVQRAAGLAATFWSGKSCNQVKIVALSNVAPGVCEWPRAPAGSVRFTKADSTRTSFYGVGDAGASTGNVVINGLFGQKDPCRGPVVESGLQFNGCLVRPQKKKIGFLVAGSCLAAAFQNRVAICETDIGIGGSQSNGILNSVEAQIAKDIGSLKREAPAFDFDPMNCTAIDDRRDDAVKVECVAGYEEWTMADGEKITWFS